MIQVAPVRYSSKNVERQMHSFRQVPFQGLSPTSRAELEAKEFVLLLPGVLAHESVMNNPAFSVLLDQVKKRRFYAAISEIHSQQGRLNPEHPDYWSLDNLEGIVHLNIARLIANRSAWAGTPPDPFSMSKAYEVTRKLWLERAEMMLEFVDDAGKSFSGAVEATGSYKIDPNQKRFPKSYANRVYMLNQLARGAETHEDDNPTAFANEYLTLLRKDGVIQASPFLQSVAHHNVSVIYQLHDELKLAAEHRQSAEQINPLLKAVATPTQYIYLAI